MDEEEEDEEEWEDDGTRGPEDDLEDPVLLEKDGGKVGRQRESEEWVKGITSHSTVRGGKEGGR